MNYNLSNPMSSFFNTASNLQSLKSNSMNLQQQQNEMEAAKVQAEQQALTQQRVSEIMPLVKSGDYDATIELATLDPNMSDAINKAKANLSEGQDREMINWLTQYQSAPDKAAFLQQDNPNLTVDDNFRGMSEEQRDVMARIVGAQLMPKEMFNAAFGKQASKEFQYKDGIVFDPSTGEVKKTELYDQGNSGQGGEQSTSNMKDFQFYQELKKSNPEMAEEFAVKAGIRKVAPKKGMSVTTERILNDAQNAAYDAFSSSDSITSLADSYAQNKGDLGGGLFGSAQEAFKEFAGGEDEISSLKKQYARIKNSLVIKSLPQGPATDRDIAIFSKGFPGENADPEYIESFLRGMAKSQYITGRFNEFKAQHISDKGNTSGLMKAWKEESKKLDSELKEKFPEQSMPNVSSLSDEDLLNG